MTELGMTQLREFTNKLKKGDRFYLQPMKKEKARSHKQSSLYWSAIVPAMQYYCDFLNEYNLPEHKEIAHKIIKINYCFLVREDLLQTVKYIHPITKRQVVEQHPFSWKFSEMPTKEANDYVSWCKTIIEKYSTVDFDTAIRGMM